MFGEIKNIGGYEQRLRLLQTIRFRSNNNVLTKDLRSFKNFVSLEIFIYSLLASKPLFTAKPRRVSRRRHANVSLSLSCLLVMHQISGSITNSFPG